MPTHPPGATSWRPQSTVHRTKVDARMRTSTLEGAARTKPRSEEPPSGGGPECESA